MNEFGFLISVQIFMPPGQLCHLEEILSRDATSSLGPFHSSIASKLYASESRDQIFGEIKKTSRASTRFSGNVRSTTFKGGQFFCRTFIILRND